MKANDPRELALAVLSRQEKNHHTLDRVIKEVVEPHGLRGKDRALLNALVYGVLRWRGRLDFLLSQFSNKALRKIEPAILNILRLGLFQIIYLDRIPNSAAVNTSVELAKSKAPPWVAGFVNGILRNAVRKSDNLPSPDHGKNPIQAIAVEKSAPAWLVKRWTDRFGPQEAADLCDALNHIPPISVRTNTLKAGRDQLMAALEKLTESVAPTAYAPDGIRLQNPNARIPEMDAFKQGWFQVQDEAAQLASLLLDPQPGESVLDACAGLGGKTGHIAQLMRNRGSIVALDIDSEKLTRLEAQMARLGVSIVRTQQQDLKNIVDKQIGQPFDRILLDAPCTGMGVLRRNPDAKWDPLKRNFGRFAQRQMELLASLKPLLKATGILVYAVCSIEPEENEAVIDAFLSRYPDLEIDAHPGILPSELYDRLDIKKGIKTHPAFTDMDGFYMVRLKRMR